MSHFEQAGSTFTAQCEGWWDIIGLFTLRGTLNAQGEVTLLKQYLGQHSVQYFGRYDGEGVLAGEWRIYTEHGRWAIKIKSAE